MANQGDESKLKQDFAERLAKVAAAGGCPKCACPNVLIPTEGIISPFSCGGDLGVNPLLRQCFNCGNKFEWVTPPDERRTSQ